ncbi:MAG: hypothetical protein IT385_16010, partial [Deltaproteobacteria bacterium]|nr:hypothetical protein [Deltaproteobacteria bacterium]
MNRTHARALALLPIISALCLACSGGDDDRRDVTPDVQASDGADGADGDVPLDVDDATDTTGGDAPLDVDIPDVPTPTEGGLLVPPQGRPASDYEAGNAAGDVPVAADGRFAFGDPGPGVKVTVATPTDAADADLNALMAITASPPGEDPPRGIVISARTTAVALAFLSPLVATRDPQRARAILDIAPHLPEIETLAALVHLGYGALADPLADPQLAAARDEAVLALAVASVLIPATPTGGGPAATDRAGHRAHPLDPGSHVQVRVEGKDVIIETRPGVPLASLFRLEQVDVDALHTIDRQRLLELGNADALLLSSAQADALRSHTCKSEPPFYPRFTAMAGTRHYGHTAGDSHFGRLDLAGQAVDFVFGVIIDTVASGVGLDLEPEGKLPIDTSRPGLYVLRAFNGMRGDGADCGEKQFAKDHFPVEESSAFALNLTLTAFDVLAFVIDIRDYWGQCVAQEVDRVMSGDRSWDGSFGDLWDLFGDTLEFAGECVSSALLDFVGDQGQEAAIKAGKRLGRVVRTFAVPLADKTTFTKLDDEIARLARALDPFAKAAIAGTIVDRLWALFGGGGSAAAWVTFGYLGASNLSPVDTWLVRIGDPFGPRVGSIEVGGVPTGITLARERQVLVKTGDSVTLVGASLTERGAPIGDALLTSKGGVIARVPLTRVADDRVTFVVPSGLADTVALDLVTTDTTVPIGTVLVIEPELLGVSRRDMFRVARDSNGKALYTIGGDYLPAIEVTGRGLAPDTMVVRPAPAAPSAGVPESAGFVNRFGSHDRRLVLGDSAAIPTGVHTLVLDTGITSPALLAKYPDGRITTALEVRVLPAPAHRATSPTAVSTGQVFQLTGDNFGTDREAVSLEVVTGATTTLPLDVFFVIDDPAGGGAGVQPAILSARMIHLLMNPWKEGTPDITLRLTTPAGQVELVVPVDRTPIPHLARRVDVMAPSGWVDAVAIINGTYAGADLAEVFAWKLESTPHPSGEGDLTWCGLDPGRDDWSLEADGSNPVGVSRPPGIEAGGGCVRTCMWEGTWVWTGPDNQAFLYDPRNDILDLPKTPCPSSWGGIAPPAIVQSLVAEGPLSIPPTDIYAYHLGLALDVDSGGGLHFIGFDGRSQLGGAITIAEPRVPDPQIPLVHLDGIENVDLRLDLRNAEGCNVAVKITRAKDVRLLDPMIDGCKIGIDIEDSEGVVVQEGFVRGYGEDGIGIRIRASQGVRVTRTLVRPDRSGDGSAITTSARGVVVSHGSRGVRVTVEARKHGKGIEILDAHDVVVGGWIGAARDGADPGTNSANVIGIDVVGPATDVLIGGNPAKAPTAVDPDAAPTGETTIIADNGRVGALPGAGVRLGDVTRVEVSRAYIGVVPGQMNEGNRVGIEVTAQAKDVLIERCHIGDNTVAGVEIVGGDGGVVLRDVLFAGREQASWAHRRAFPTVTAGFPEAARCTLATLADASFDPDLPPAFAPSTGG